MSSINYNAYPINYSSATAVNTAEPQIDEEKKKKIRQHHYGKKVAMATLGVGLTALAVGHGYSKGGRVKLNELYNYLRTKSDKIAEKIKNNQVVSKTDKIFKHVIDKLEPVGRTLRSIPNIISIKDTIFKKMTDNIPVIGKSCEAITRFFKKIAINRTTSSYDTTSKHFDKVFELFEKANKKYSFKISSEARDNLKNIRSTFDKNFRTGSARARIDETISSEGNPFKKLADYFSKKFERKEIWSFIKDKNTYSTFVAENKLAGNKLKLISEVSLQKAKINFTSNDDYNYIKKTYESIEKLIDPSNSEAKDLIKTIKGLMKKVTSDDLSDDARKDLIENLKKLNTFVSDKNIAEKFEIGINNIENLKYYRKEGLRKVLEDYKKVMTPKEFSYLEKQVNKALKSLEESTNLETESLFDKNRDLVLGSAPTDILTILGTFGTLGVGLYNADNKDDRISISIKYGIPALGGIAITTLATARMISGMKGLGLGIISSYIFNKIGEYIDEIRIKAKNHDEGKAKLDLKPTKEEVANAIIDNTEILTDAKNASIGAEFAMDMTKKMSKPIRNKIKEKMNNRQTP